MTNPQRTVRQVLAELCQEEQEIKTAISEAIYADNYEEVEELSEKSAYLLEEISRLKLLKPDLIYQPLLDARWDAHR